MKKLLILSLATLGFIACSKRADYIVLSGKIDGYNGMPLKITGGDFSADLHINPADGTFRDTLKVATNYYYYSIGNQMYGIDVPLYLEKGNQVEVDINLKSNPIGATFKGDDTLINNYLQKKNAIHLQVQQGFRELLGQDPETFKKSVVELGKQYLALLDSEKELSKKFVTMEVKSINYELLYIKKIYEKSHEGTPVQLPKEMKEELKRLNYDLSQDFEVHKYYKELVFTNVQDKYDPEQEGEGNPWAKVIAHIDSLQSENIKAGIARLLTTGISVINTPEDNNTLIEVVKKNAKDSITTAALNKRLELLENLKEGKDFPAFEAQDMEGNTVTSESLKGKVLYVDIWATWCTPCRQEIPALKALEEEYKGKDITFVSISIDQNMAAWKSVVENEKLGGIQLHVMDIATLFNNYDINGIPRFILVDKEGKLISINAPRPSDPEIKELINAHL